MLFPEQIGGRYLRLERPFPIFGHGCRPVFDIWLSESPVLNYWGRPQVILDVEHVPCGWVREDDGQVKIYYAAPCETPGEDG